MLVGAAVVVGQMQLGDARAEEFDDFGDGGVGEVDVGYVERDPAGVEVAYAEDFEQVPGGGDGIGQVFEQQPDAERRSEGLQVLDRGEGVLERVVGPLARVGQAEMQDAGGRGEVFGELERALELLHGLNAAGFFRRDQVEGGAGVAGELRLGRERRVQGGPDAGVAEPCCQFTDLAAVGVVDMVPRGAELNDADAGRGEGVEVRGGEAMRIEKLGGETEDHQEQATGFAGTDGWAPSYGDCMNDTGRSVGGSHSSQGRDEWGTFARGWRDLAVLCGFAAVLLVVWAALGNGYGFHRDELQFLSDARHLAWGFVAYPPMTSFCGRVAIALFGISPHTFRLPAALLNACSLVLTGLVARELGGRRAAQVLALAAMVPVGLAFGSVLQYNTPDLLAWLLVVLFTSRVLRTGNQRNWVGVGVGIGLGVLSKYSIAFCAASLLIGLAVLPSQRHQLRSRWLWAGVGVATLIAGPNLVWLAAHGFITLKMETYIHARDVGLGRADGYFTDQVKFTMLALPLAVTGLVSLVRSPRFRLLSVFYLGPLMLFALARGRGYYLLPAYPVLYAAGAVALERALAGRRQALPVGVRGLAYAALLGNAAAISWAYLPMWHPGSAGWKWQMTHNYDMADEVGWPEFVEQVAAVRDGLSPQERQGLGLLANNYGEAGALEFYGARYGLPQVISSTNSFHPRGYGSFEPETVIVTGGDLKDQRENFAECRVAAAVVIPYGVRNEESRDHPVILVCRHLKGNWAQVWAKSQEFG